jgi:ankyrin repeat protein
MNKIFFHFALISTFLLTLNTHAVPGASLDSKEASYIHEPFWRYSPDQLQAYSKRIIKKISPHFIDESCIDRQNNTVRQGEENIAVRKVKEFGRVLPLLYLRDLLEQQNSADKAVPRIFIIPNKVDNISFKFYMPHRTENQRRMTLDVANNLLQITSDSFTIFQEYIEGDAIVGDKSFAQYGHCDFNAKQIVTSRKNGKKYLIDTKESKNFFLPQLSPITGCAAMYWNTLIGRFLPQNSENFKQWQREQQDLILQEKSENHPIDLPFVKIDIPRECKSLEASEIAGSSIFFDDDNEEELYFNNPKDNLARYLSMDKIDLFQIVIAGNPEISLDNIVVPTQTSPTELVECTPVQAILRSTLTTEKCIKLLGVFDSHPNYFENPVNNIDINFWPLHMALQRNSPELLELIINCGANPNHKIRRSSILDHALDLLYQTATLQNEDNYAAQLKIVEIILKAVDIVDEKTIITVAERNNVDLFGMILEKNFDQKILITTLQQILTCDPESEFNEMPHADRMKLIKCLLSKLDYVNSEILKSAFKLNKNEIVVALSDLNFDADFALYEAVIRIDHPSGTYVKDINDGKSPIYYYGLIVKILKDGIASDEAIDKAISYALLNSKLSILKLLLKYRPNESTRTENQLVKIVQNKYEGPEILKNAILTNSTLLLRLLVAKNIQINNYEFLLAVRDSINQEIMDILISSQTLDLHTALDLAIDNRCIYAVEQLALKIKNIRSGSYQRAFKTKNSEIIDAVINSLGDDLDERDNTILMELQDVEKLCSNGDIAVIKDMVKRRINLGEALVAAVKFITYVADKKTNIDPWYILVSKLIDMNPPAEAVDRSMAIALLNLQGSLIQSLGGKFTADSPQTKQNVEQIVKDQYTKMKYFSLAVVCGNANLIRLFNECGMYS